MLWKCVAATLLVITGLAVSAACQVVPGPTPTPGPSATVSPTQTPAPTASPTLTATPTSSATYSVPELKYRLIAEFGGVFYCDPDFYPIGRPGQEEKNAAEQLPAIRADRPEFSAILAHLGLPDKPDYTDEDTLAIYREHKKLSLAVQLTASGSIYSFTLRVGEGQGERIDGTITPSGRQTVTQRQPVINTCPICLAKGAMIDTPSGVVAVEDLVTGMAVWTVDGLGARTAGTVLETAVTGAPDSFQMVRVTLADGRSVQASPGHPTAVGRPLGDYRVGDSLDGGLVVAADRVDYDAGLTYDLLPSGTTALYWANGILLKSTLAAR
ncbi:MAG: hypothetical protein Q7T04_00100 [Dehalococcoidia bacterium]|nr:hypothetical protein [Dehalococcoidia bacterium]